MKFAINPHGSVERRSITYNANEYSFDTTPSLHEEDLTLVLNKLNLTVRDSKVVQVWGLCSYGEWAKTNHDAPPASEGSLELMDVKAPGFSYRIDEGYWPTYANTERGWVCIGDPGAPGDAVKFMTGCIAVIDKNNNLASLWLKPEDMPVLSSKESTN